MVDRAKQIEYLAKELSGYVGDPLPVAYLYNIVQEEKRRRREAPLPPPHMFDLESVDGVYAHYVG